MNSAPVVARCSLRRQFVSTFGGTACGGVVLHWLGLFVDNCCFGRLETDLRVRAVTKRLIDAAAATAERERPFACQVILVAIGVEQLDFALFTLQAIGPIRAYCDLYRHDVLRVLLSSMLNSWAEKHASILQYTLREKPLSSLQC